MTPTFDPLRDLTITRVIRAPRGTVWRGWAEPDLFERWFLPAPARLRLVRHEFEPGGALETEMSDDGATYTHHLSACFLAIDPARRLVFTNALTGGWRPAATPFMTAVIDFLDHPEGTEYRAHVLHADAAIRASHVDYGFHAGWGTVADQLARLVEAPA